MVEQRLEGDQTTGSTKGKDSPPPFDERLEQGSTVKKTLHLATARTKT